MRCDPGDEIGPGVVSTPQLLQVIGRHHRLLRHVEPDHRQRPARVKDDVGRFRIVADVGLGNGRGVTRYIGCTAHQDDFAYVLGDARLRGDGEGNVGQRTQRYQGDLARVGYDSVDDELRGTAP